MAVIETANSAPVKITHNILLANAVAESVAVDIGGAWTARFYLSDGMQPPSWVLQFGPGRIGVCWINYQPVAWENLVGKSALGHLASCVNRDTMHDSASLLIAASETG